MLKLSKSTEIQKFRISDTEFPDSEKITRFVLGEQPGAFGAPSITALTHTIRNTGTKLRTIYTLVEPRAPTPR